MIRHDGGSVETVMRAVDELQQMVGRAQLRLGSQCVLNRSMLLDVLKDITDALPSAVTQATAIVVQEKDILDKARREAAETLRKSREEAQKLIDDAKRQAEELNVKARQDSEAAAREKQETHNAAEGEKARAQKEADAMRAQGQRDLENARQQAQSEMTSMRQQCQKLYQDAVNHANAEHGA
ncbi:MAG: hypothetical protein IKK57_10035, partial [Clostridia bacterium]|nr:hypothetical protein [Clostridia bacterium]